MISNRDYLTIEKLTRTIGRQLILNGIDLTLEKSQILCLLGPSGSGKTSLLRIIAGLDQPDEGRVYLQGRCLNSIPPHRRQVGFMFQDLALFPHKSVFENVAFGVALQKKSPTEIQRAIAQMLDLVGLTGFEERRVDALSGGERQRVALARSLAPQPALLLLDEPLGALDRRLRDQLTTDLRRILRAANVTAVMVTHDQSEAFRIADRVAVLIAGRILQSGIPREIYQAPVSVDVAGFMGLSNCLPAKIVAEDRVQTEIGEFDTVLPPANSTPRGMLVLHPDSAEIDLDALDTTPLPPMRMVAEIEEVLFQGTSLRVVFHWQNRHRLRFDLSRRNINLAPGQRVVLKIDGHRTAFIPDAAPLENPGQKEIL